jgi:hypothetical protein
MPAGRCHLQDIAVQRYVLIILGLSICFPASRISSLSSFVPLLYPFASVRASSWSAVTRRRPMMVGVVGEDELRERRRSV